MIDASRLIGSHDVLFVTLDTLRYDVAAQLYAAGRTPQLAGVLPPGGWEKRIVPAAVSRTSRTRGRTCPRKVADRKHPPELTPFIQHN